MSDITIYHNPRCSKSRQTLEILQNSGIEPAIVHYLDEIPDKTILIDLLEKLDKEPRDILRKSEQAYKDLNLSDSALSNDVLIDAMINNPKLIERPIVVRGDKAVLGRPPENVLELIK